MNTRMMVSTLTEAGVEVDLVTYPFGEDTPMKGLVIHRLRRPPLMKEVPIGPSGAKIILDLEMVFSAYRLACKRCYDVIHTIEEAVYIGILLKKRFGIPLIYDMDSSLKDQMANYGWARLGIVQKGFAFAERLAITGADSVITVCQALTDVVKAIEPGKMVYQIEDIPLEVEPSSPADADDLASDMEGRPVLLYTGNFEPYQGIELLIESLPLVLEKKPEALLVLVGGKGKWVTAIREQIGRLGLEHNVLLVDPRPPAEMDWFMSRAYVLLSPRLKGTNTPLKIYTYLKSGRPIVATRLPTHTQVLEDGWSVLVEPEAGAFAAGILRLLDDRREAEAIGGRGKSLVEERYSREHFRQKLLEAYKEVRIKGKRRAVFLDRDGVINRRIIGDYIRTWSDFEFLPGVAGAVRDLNKQGFLVVIVTNQQGIGRGLMDERSLEEIHRRMMADLKKEGAVIDAVYYCPHISEAGCRCRKPQPGLLFEAAAEMGIDLSSSYMVGDSASDIEAARKAGCRPVLIGDDSQNKGEDYPVFQDLPSLATSLAGEEGSGR